jgi:signal transduction histidine kinase
MRRNFTGLSRQYQVALRKHLGQGPKASLQAAQGLGSRAMAVGLETLDLVRIHEQALIALVLPSDPPEKRDAVVRRAGIFFAEAITPIEKTHRIAQESNVHMDRLNQTLRRRNTDLAASNRQLKQEIARRKSAEGSLRKSEQHYGKLLEQSRRMQEQLRMLSRQLLSAQEEERKRISRELHDVIAQTLTSINVRLASLKKEAAVNTKGLERSIARTQKLVERSVSIVHRFARELRPTVLDDVGLVPALHSFMKDFSKQTGIRMQFTTFTFARIKQLDNDQRTVLYRVAQEALNNAARHARASQAGVKIWKLDGKICMEIKDNGKGFAAERVLLAKKNKRLGLLGMRERVEMVNGNFTIKSRPGKGTTILAQIPLTDVRANGGGKPAGTINRRRD